LTFNVPREKSGERGNNVCLVVKATRARVKKRGKHNNRTDQTRKFTQIMQKKKGKGKKVPGEKKPTKESESQRIVLSGPRSEFQSHPGEKAQWGTLGNGLLGTLKGGIFRKKKLLPRQKVNWNKSKSVGGHPCGNMGNRHREIRGKQGKNKAAPTRGDGPDQKKERKMGWGTRKKVHCCRYLLNKEKQQ